MKSIAEKMRAAVSPVDKFAAAESAMAGGTLNATASVVHESTGRDTPKAAEGERSVVRENFSFPPADSALIDTLRKRAATKGVLLNRSEILRAGLAALNALTDEQIALIGGAVPKMKTGRPRAS